MKYKISTWLSIILIVCFAIPNVLCVYDDLENFINPNDISYLMNDDVEPPVELASSQSVNANHSLNFYQRIKNKVYNFFNISKVKNYTQEIPINVDCFGFGSISTKLSWIFNLKPLQSEELQVEFYFSSRNQRQRVLVLGGDQFGLEWVKYNPKLPTIVIVHGFLSYSNASWIRNMTKAFLDWNDVNVITVDWSRGGRTWKYWRAVANTRTVGTDLADFLRQLMDATGAQTKDFHFIGHSLGAHICSFAAAKLGGVRRITGLDPAQPCFITTNLDMLLDKTDADFVDVIHTNGRLLSKLGLGVPNICGHQDFYPNGGSKQPGCHTKKLSFVSNIFPISHERLMRAMCNHGRAYLLFTESLKNNNCSLVGHRWNLKYSGVNASINAPCTKHNCSELGVKADRSNARGSFYVFTTSSEPFCAKNPIEAETREHLLSDLKKKETNHHTENVIISTPTMIPMTTTKPKKKSIFRRAFSFIG